jgi:sugar porter (SP) family MFS transporter
VHVIVDTASTGNSTSRNGSGPPDQERKYNLTYAAGVACVASAGGFLFGFDLVIIAGILPFLVRDFDLTPAMAGWAAGSAVLGAILGPLVGLWFADTIGRRRTMMIAALAFMLSTIGCYFAPSVGHFAFWRVVGGMGVGLAMISCPIYIAELSPAPLRGVLVNVNQLVNVVGINLAVVVGYVVGAYNGDWRLMMATQAVPAGILMFGLMFVPESPRWLAARGLHDRALAVLARINGPEHARVELDQIIKDVSESAASGVAEVFKPYSRKPLIAGIILMIFSQINGVNMILLYGPTILQDAGISFGADSVLSSIPTYLMIFVATLVSFPLIHRYSRRGLLIASVLGMALGHVLMAFLLAVKAPALWILAPMMICAGTFTVGLAPLSWIIVSEIFPNSVRSHALAIVCVFLFGSSFITAQLFPMVMDWLRQTTGTPAGMYLGFAAICVSCAVFVWRRMPETKGLSLEEMSAFWRTRATPSSESA